MFNILKARSTTANTAPETLEEITSSPSGTKNPLDVSVLSILSNQVPFEYDNGTVDYPSDTQEIYKFYLGATLLKTLTLNYVDLTKEQLNDWAWT